MLTGVKDSEGKYYLEESENPGDILFQRAWHGSPYDFETFDLGAIGTGEGAQAHGYGFYSSAKREVAERYQKVLTEKTKGNFTKFLRRLTGIDIGQKFESCVTSKVTQTLLVLRLTHFVFESCVTSEVTQTGRVRDYRGCVFESCVMLAKKERHSSAIAMTENRLAIGAEPSVVPYSRFTRAKS